MAASNFDLDAAMHSLSTDGLYHLDDFLIGQRISEMEEKGFPYFTEYGLDFYRTILDTRLRSLLGSILGNCTLGHWLRYQDYKGHIECFRRGGQKAGRNVLMIHCWAKGSQVNYFPRSHLHDLDTTIGKRSLYEVDQSKLELAGLSPHEQLFPDGGLVVLDARLAFEIKEGYAITFLFATDNVVAQWAKMVLPYSAGLAQKVADIEDDGSSRSTQPSTPAKIGANFVFFRHPNGKTDE